MRGIGRLGGEEKEYWTMLSPQSPKRLIKLATLNAWAAYLMIYLDEINDVSLKQLDRRGLIIWEKDL